MLSKRCLAVAVGLVIPHLVPVHAVAQAGPVQGACAGDIKAVCGSVQPGGGRIRDCMREHRAQLSATCKIAIADRMLERGRGQSAGTQAVGARPTAASAGIRPVPEN